MTYYKTELFSLKFLIPPFYLKKTSKLISFEFPQFSTDMPLKDKDFKVINQDLSDYEDVCLRHNYISFPIEIKEEFIDINSRTGDTNPNLVAPLRIQKITSDESIEILLNWLFNHVEKIADFIHFQFCDIDDCLPILLEINRIVSNVKGNGIQLLRRKKVILDILSEIINEIQELHNSIEKHSKSQTIQGVAKKIIQKHIVTGTLTDYIDKIIDIGYLFFEKSNIIGFKEYEETIELTSEEKEYIDFFLNISGSYATDEIRQENYLIKIENNDTILKGLKNELVNRLNNFPNDKMQINYANILINKVQYLDIIYEILLSFKEDVSFSNRDMTTFELERATFYTELTRLIEGYKSVLVLLIQSYHPEEDISHEDLRENNELLDIKFKHSTHKISLLDQLGVIDFLKTKYPILKDNNTKLASLLGGILEITDKTEKDTLRKNLSYLDPNHKKTIRNEKSDREIRAELLKLGIEI